MLENAMKENFKEICHDVLMSTNIGEYCLLLNILFKTIKERQGFRTKIHL